jgi:aldehyde dehydrogenase (NAD+)
VSIAEKFYTMEYGAAPEDPKEAVQWLERHHRRFEEFIGGAWVEAGERRVSNHQRSLQRRDACRGGQGQFEDVNAAVAAARKALPGWQALSGHERARYLYALARLVQKHSRRLAVLETMDNGKPIRESRDIDIPWWRGTFIIMPAGRSCWSRSFPATRRAAWWARSFRGIFRC